VSLLKPPSKEECIKEGLLNSEGKPITSRERASAKTPASTPFSSLATQPFGGKG
jgi:hypothetical protein